MAQSYWQMLSPGAGYPTLESDIQPGIAVIGGGITGLTAALLMAERGADVALLEARRVGMGTTGCSTGKVTVQHGDIYGRLLRSHGWDTVVRYFGEMRRAFDFIRQRHTDLSLSFAVEPNIVFATGDSGRVRLKDDYQAGRAVGLHSALQDHIDLPIRNLSAVRVEGQLAINPKAYCDALAAAFVRRGGRIYERTAVTEVGDGDMVRLHTRQGHTVTAHTVIQAVGYPLYPKIGTHMLRLRPVRSHLMAFRLRQDFPRGMYISLDRLLPTLRTHEHMGQRMLIVGGMSHRVGAAGEQVYRHIEAYARHRFDLSPAVACWGAEDYVTPDGMPYVGRGGDHAHIYTAVGFKKWGLTGGTAAGMALADAALGGCFAPGYPFAPRRVADLLTTQAVGNALESGGHFIGDRFAIAAGLPRRAGEGRILLVGGRRCGAYRRQDGELLIVMATCTHLAVPSVSMPPNRAGIAPAMAPVSRPMARSSTARR